MKNLLLKIFATVLIVGIFHACNEPLVEEQVVNNMELKSAQTGKTSYIVVLNDAELNAELANLKGYEKRQQVAKKAAEKVMNRAGVTDGELGFVYGTAIKGFSVKIPPGQLKKLENDPSVKYIEENQIITLIEPKAKPGDNDVQATAQTIPWGITRVNGGVAYSGSKKAWIIDSGIDLDHPDLNVITSLSKTFVPRTSSADDDNGHGSHVAGTVAAKNDGTGVVGVAAGAELVAIKVLDRRGSGSYDGVIAGVDYVADNATSGDVANMSLGGPTSDALDAAIIAAANKGIKFALAAGNESTNANNSSPARVNHSNVFTISASDINDNWAYFSNYGNPPVDYCQPGVNIYSTYKGGGYTTMSGTSMASPHMAGLLLLGNTKTDGTVNGDPDGNADPILIYNGTVTPPDNADPTADFSWSASELTVNFTDLSSDSDGTIKSWSWNFGDGSSSLAQNPSLTYAAAGTYVVSLTVTDDDGATGTISKNVTVSSSSTNEAPAIADFSLTNTSNPAMKRVQVNWSVTDSDGDLKTVETQLSGPGTASALTNVSGFSASGVHELSVKKGSSGLYTVTITVTDVAGNTTTDSKDITL